MTPLIDDMAALKSRCDISHVLNKHGLTGACAEVGVNMGHYANAVLKDWLGAEYNCVDLWENQDLTVYEETFDHALAWRCVTHLAEKDKRVRLIKQLSTEAANGFANESLDWVWIDANHAYQPVLDDMRAWWPKVKVGGVFSGHDYFHPGVNPAVNEWMKEHAQPFVVSDSSWWSVKPPQPTGNYGRIKQLIHGDTNPYAGFPVQQWRGNRRNDSLERPVFHKTMREIRPKLIIEVGSLLGGSALHMAQLIKAMRWDTAILCIDTWLGGFEYWDKDRSILRPWFGRPSLYYNFMANVIEDRADNVIVPFSLDSINAARWLQSRGVKCQMIYLDASHQGGDVLRDLEAYWPLLESGGALIADDLTNCFPGCLEDWKTFVATHGLEPRIEDEKGVVIKP